MIPAGSLADTIMRLYDGLMISKDTYHHLIEEAALVYNKNVPFFHMAVDGTLSGIPTEGIGNGYILTTTPDRNRTAAIKNWTYIEYYDEDRHGHGFQTAIIFIRMFAEEHIKTYKRLAGVLELDQDEDALLHKVTGIFDWGSIWNIYNKLVYGHTAKNEATTQLRENMKKVGLHDRRIFERYARGTNKATLVSGAVYRIQEGSGLSW